MPHADRRLPRVTVQQLRRDLREADEDRFRLTVWHAQQARAPRNSRNFAMMFLMAAGLSSAFLNGRAPALATHTVDASAPLPSIPLAFSALVPVAAEPAAIPRAGAIHAKPAARARRTAAIRVNVAARAGQAQGLGPRHRHVPRPLHPGEFGRKPGRD
jgi:hypothetical protein